MSRVFYFSLAFLGLFLLSLPAQAQISTLGVLGDSISDLENPPDVSNYHPWTRWASESSGVNFGTYDSWPDFRHTDYEYNYAHGGATTSSMISEGQHTLLAAEGVDVASYLNGANDLAYWFEDHAFWILFQDNKDPRTYVTPTMIANFNTAVETVAGTAANPTGTDMVIWGCPDIMKMPKIKEVLWLTYWGTTSKYRGAAVNYNNAMQDVAEDRHWLYLDTMGMEDVLCAGSSFSLAGVTISYNNLFYNDKIHPGKVFTGLMSNLFTRGLNLKYGTSYPLLSDQTILTAAGYSPAPGETYFNVDPYIILNNPGAVPEPACISLLLAGLTGMSMARKRKRA
ncbi:MAG: PEP-CTERM sorting domain-containing protein [Phycisphaerae bacterium]|nr:PEP-CTERM sorting domain-containing protein [Phycisphaerae bacterium]